VAAILLGRLRSEVPDFEDADYGLSGLEARLRAELGGLEVDRAMATGARLSIAEVAQLVTDTINDVAL
jgi:hypothetical protein